MGKGLEGRAARLRRGKKASGGEALVVSLLSSKAVNDRTVVPLDPLIFASQANSTDGISQKSKGRGGAALKYRPSGQTGQRSGDMRAANAECITLATDEPE